VPSTRQVPEQQCPHHAPGPQVPAHPPPSTVQQRPPWHVLSAMARQFFSQEPQCDGELSRSQQAAFFVFDSPHTVPPGRHRQRFRWQLEPFGHLRPPGLQRPPTNGFRISATARFGARPLKPASSPLVRPARSPRREALAAMRRESLSNCLISMAVSQIALRCRSGRRSR
jgi:hypothetical protein